MFFRRRGSNDEQASSSQQKQKSNVGTPTDGQPPSSNRTRAQSNRWNISSWLRWIFEDELLDGPGADFDDLYVQGQYFVPADSTNTTGSERKRLTLLDILSANLSRKDEQLASEIIKTRSKLNASRSDNNPKEAKTISSIPPPAVYVAPCPNCMRGTCRIRKHKQLRKYLEQQQNQNLSLAPKELNLHCRNASGSSGTSNSSTGNSPLLPKPANSNGFFPPTSTTTPYNADDENSDPESEGFGVDEKYFPYINQTSPMISLTEFKSQLFLPNRDERLRGDGETSTKVNNTQSARKKTKGASNSKSSHHQHQDANTKSHSPKQLNNPTVSKLRSRVPPEGRERLSQTQPYVPSSANIRGKPNLSCGNIGCQDSFCSSQSIGMRNSSSYREESVDSLVGVSGSMVDLVKGAREVRRMIRETSMDSICSDFSLSSYVGNTNMNRNEDLDYLVQIDSERFLSELSSIRTSCDELKNSLTAYPPNTNSLLSGSKSDFAIKSAQVEVSLHDSESSIKDTSTSNTGDGSSSPDLRNLHRRLRQKEKKMWRLSAPISDVDSPQHLSSRNHTAEEDSSLEWESPGHGWHDVRHAKYKVALHQSRSQSLAASDCEDNLDNCDQWEWDSEGLGDEIGKDTFSHCNVLNGIDFELSREHDNWLPDKLLELDLESELGRVSFNGSINNSRRNSYCSNMSDFDGTESISRQIRLPPSGRSSVAKGM